jgi:hypothetical protein
VSFVNESQGFLSWGQSQKYLKIKGRAQTADEQKKGEVWLSWIAKYIPMDRETTGDNQ